MTNGVSGFSGFDMVSGFDAIGLVIAAPERLPCRCVFALIWKTAHQKRAGQASYSEMRQSDGFKLPTNCGS